MRLSILLAGLVLFSQSSFCESTYDYEHEIRVDISKVVKSNTKFETIQDMDGKTIAILKNGINGIHFKQLCQSFDIKCKYLEVKTYDEIAEMIVDKYDGGIAKEVARQAAKDYFVLGVVPMAMDPKLRKSATDAVKTFYKERAKRLAAKNKPVEQEVTNAN